MNKPHTIYISLGSNINPVVNIHRAINTIQSVLADCETAPVYRSPAVGMSGADFFNTVISGRTNMSAADTYEWLREIERRQGRVRTHHKYTDRTLDLDLLLFDDQVTQKLPHQEIAEQAYVLQPLYDIAPLLQHPVLNCSITSLRSTLMAQCPQLFSALIPVAVDEMD